MKKPIDIWVKDSFYNEEHQLYQNETGFYIESPFSKEEPKARLCWNVNPDHINLGHIFISKMRNGKEFILTVVRDERSKENKMTQHNGLPVVGYKPQSDDKIKLVNVNKELEERLIRRIKWFENENKKAFEVYNAQYNPPNSLLQYNTTKPPFEYPYDCEMLHDAKKGIIAACMWLNRAVFQPGCVQLPEDKND